MYVGLLTFYNSMNRKHVNASIFWQGVAALTRCWPFRRLGV